MLFFIKTRLTDIPKKPNAMRKKVSIFTVITVMIVSMLAGCSDVNSNVREGSLAAHAYNQDIQNAVHMYVSLTSSSSEEEWAKAKEVIAARMQVFAGEFQYLIEDTGNILHIVAEEEMFSDEDIAYTMTYFITKPLRFGLYLPESMDFKFFNENDIVSVSLEDREASKESEIRIALNPGAETDWRQYLQQGTILFGFSLGSVFYEIPVELDENDSYVLYLKNEMDNRYQAVQYYDLTTPMPYVSTDLHIYPRVTWERPSEEGDSKQCLRSELISPAKEVVYRYDATLSIVEYNNILSVLKNRLAVLNYDYAIGECYEDKSVVIAFGEDCPDNFTLQLLGSNADISLRYKYDETEYNDTASVVYSEESNRKVTLSEDITSGSPVIDFSEYGKEYLYDVTDEAAQSNSPVNVLINSYPLGYSMPKAAVPDGKLIVDETLPDYNLQECLSLMAQITQNNEDPRIPDGKISVELSIEDQYICDQSAIREPLKNWSCYEGMSHIVMESLSEDVPRLTRVDAGKTLSFYLDANQGETVVRDYVQDINRILGHYPYSKCPFRNMEFWLCDSNNTALYVLIMSTLPDFSGADSPNTVYMDLISRNAEKMEPYAEEFDAIIDKGVIRYE